MIARRELPSCSIQGDSRMVTPRTKRVQSSIVFDCAQRQDWDLIQEVYRQRINLRLSVLLISMMEWCNWKEEQGNPREEKCTA